MDVADRLNRRIVGYNQRQLSLFCFAISFRKRGRIKVVIKHKKRRQEMEMEMRRVVGLLFFKSEGCGWKGIFICLMKDNL